MKKSILFSLITVCLTFTFMVIATPSQSYAQYHIAWTKTYDSGADDRAEDIAVDSNDNLIVVGYITENESQRGYMIKYNKNGNELWNVTYTDNVNDFIFLGVSVDLNNDIVAVGRKNDGNETDALIAKYDSNGNLLWDVISDYIEGDQNVFYGITVDSSNNIFAAGQFNPPPWIQYAEDMYFVKYDQNGNQLLTGVYSTSSHNRSYDVDIDSNGNIVLVGLAPSHGFSVVKFDPNGNVLWAKIDHPGHYGRAEGAIIDPQNNIYVTGWVHYDPSIRYYRTIKFDTNGNILWHRDYREVEGSASDIDMNSEGNIIITGGAEQDILSLMYDPDGNLLGEERYDSGNSESAQGVVVDGMDNIIVTGSINNGVNEDFLTVKYALRWNIAYDVLFENSSDLGLLRQYRDQILIKTREGQIFKKLLYRVSEDALEVLLSNPELMLQAKGLIDADTYAVLDVLDGYAGIIYNTDEIVAFLDVYAQKSPPGLKLLAKLFQWDMLRKQRQGKLFHGFRLK